MKSRTSAMWRELLHHMYTVIVIKETGDYTNVLIFSATNCYWNLFAFKVEQLLIIKCLVFGFTNPVIPHNRESLFILEPEVDVVCLPVFEGTEYCARCIRYSVH